MNVFTDYTTFYLILYMVMTCTFNKKKTSFLKGIKWKEFRQR